ncbi:two-component sensor histidine kinase [Streptomyces actuosus]|uniref:histidine kinase n=1 Tax=Streptomyces actuosus TaxID=1885 RepID=A0ABS2VV60_STRAS|nr:histidine kinase [Streptomyces actuosus]MBN0046949.1 two-component sensor histidine kinase [Streptomyces actuosus]
MTDTSKTHTTGPSRGAGTAPLDGDFAAYVPRSPEVRAVMAALRGMRRDLIQDALAYRPLPPSSAEALIVRRLPPSLRRPAVWGRHAFVLLMAWLALMAGVSVGEDLGSPAYLLLSLLPAAAVASTLLRPVAAFWLSFASIPLLAVLGWDLDTWPWQPGTFAGHLMVLTLVALRTRPRTAAWMWLLTALYGLLSEPFAGHVYGSDTMEFLFLSAIALLAVTVRHIRREARQEVTAQQSATAHERSRRTLLEERTTIARELHDVVAHHMSVVAIQAEAAPYRVEDPPPELAQAFATIRENAVAALTELRRVLGVVRAEDHQAPDAPQPTLADLDALLANVREAGLTVEKTVTGAVRELPPGVELSAYRMIQEALSNTLRHAPGATARVEIGHVIGGLGLRMVNSPPPNRSTPKPSPGAGHGLTGMRERVTMLNGEMTAGPRPDGGYEVSVFLPARTTGEDET